MIDLAIIHASMNMKNGDGKWSGIGLKLEGPVSNRVLESFEEFMKGLRTSVRSTDSTEGGMSLREVLSFKELIDFEKRLLGSLIEAEKQQLELDHKG